MKKINETLFYDTTLDFSSQSEEVQNFIMNFMANNMPVNIIKEETGNSYRVLQEIYQIEELVISKYYEYVHPVNHNQNGIHTQTIKI